MEEDDQGFSVKEEFLDVQDAKDNGLCGDESEVWGPDVEQSFQEALVLYPPCGKRKIILVDEGKMYGRNELIARYIKLRTGKTRSRKQVSSHLQVVEKRRQKDTRHQSKITKIIEKHHNSLLISTNIDSNDKNDIKPCLRPPWECRSIATKKFRLVSFSAFVEQQIETYNIPYTHEFVCINTFPSYLDPILEDIHIGQICDKFPKKKGGLKDLFDSGPRDAFFLVKFWADIDLNIISESGLFYGVNTLYESEKNMTIISSTKVCSFGKQVIEKVETEYARFENGKFVYKINRSPMCEYMINFIHKLITLPEKFNKNSVLENFTILQVVSCKDTYETLLCIAYVFEISNSEHGAQHHIYRLVEDQ